MRRLLALALLMSSLAHAQTPSSPTTLARLRDHYRPLLIFAPSPEDPSLLVQLRKLKDSGPGLYSREVLVIAVPYNTPAPTDLALTQAGADAARKRFHITPADFTVILIGKDGGEKLRSRKPLSFHKLREAIDSMPMRQEEMRDRSNPDSSTGSSPRSPL